MELRKKKVAGMILNSEITCKMDIYEGEQNSKYFFNLKKKKKKKEDILYRRQCVLFKKMMATLFMTVI